MKWESILLTFVLMIMGYLIGSISFSIIFSKLFKKEDVREKGSGNAGATNALRNYGFKFGLLVFMMDFFKIILAILISWSMKNFIDSYMINDIKVEAVGFTTMIGHIWPLFFKFKGGKGVACIGGFILMINWLIFLITLLLFIFIILKVRIVSIASITIPFLALILQISFNFISALNKEWINPIFYEEIWWITSLFLFLSWTIVLIMHIPNIKRLISKTENKI